MEVADSQRKIEEVIHVLAQEITRLHAQREGISNRIARMSQIILRLRNLCGSGEDCPSRDRGHRPGITWACRRALMESRGYPLTFSELLRAIQTTLAPDTLAQKNPRASVSTVLGRLVKYGEVDVTTNNRGKRAYRWSDQYYIARQSSQLVVPNCSPMDQNSGPAEKAALDTNEES